MSRLKNRLHPHDNDLFLFYEGHLEEGVEKKIQGHLENCQECTLKLQRQALIDKKITSSALNEVPKKCEEQILSKALGLLEQKRQLIKKSDESQDWLLLYWNDLCSVAREQKVSVSLSFSVSLILLFLNRPHIEQQQKDLISQDIRESTREGVIVYDDLL